MNSIFNRKSPPGPGQARLMAHSFSLSKQGPVKVFCMPILLWHMGYALINAYTKFGEFLFHFKRFIFTSSIGHKSDDFLFVLSFNCSNKVTDRLIGRILRLQKSHPTVR